MKIVNLIIIILSLSGQIVYRGAGHFHLPNGVYLIKHGQSYQKVVILNNKILGKVKK